jgi:hypothetical protein
MPQKRVEYLEDQATDRGQIDFDFKRNLLPWTVVHGPRRSLATTDQQFPST